jgi:hypothetical protein
LIFQTGCTAKRIVSESAFNSNIGSVEDIINKVKNNNISNESFFIEKGNIYIKKNEESNRFIFNCKFQKPDKYLFSFRNRAGIEGARMYITKDTLEINDRIEKKLLYGRPEDMERVYGIPYFVLNKLFGDLVFEENVNSSFEKDENKIFLNQRSGDGVWKSFLDTKNEKVKSTEFSEKNRGKIIEIIYSKFGKNRGHFPEDIEFKDITKGINGHIYISKMVIPWNGEIEFIPGKGYIKEEIK